MQLQSSHCRLVSFLPVYLINMLLFSTLVAVSGVPKIRPMFGDLLGLTALIAKIYDSGLVRMHKMDRRRQRRSLEEPLYRLLCALPTMNGHTAHSSQQHVCNVSAQGFYWGLITKAPSA